MKRAVRVRLRTLMVAVAIAALACSAARPVAFSLGPSHHEVRVYWGKAFVYHARHGGTRWAGVGYDRGNR